MHALIRTIEYFLPEKCETNNDLVAENPTWKMEKIFEKTGIISRRIAGLDECASDLAFGAAERVFESGVIGRGDIDTLIFCSQAPDYFLPTTACILQDRLGLPTTVSSFDINLGCSAYIYGLGIASSMINAGISSNVLLLCADTYSKYIRNDDHTCRTLFGDAGAATLLVKAKTEGDIGPFVFGTDGRGMEKLIVRGGGHRSNAEKILEMDGSSLFMFTLSAVPECVKKIMENANKTIDEIDMIFFHQASKIIIESISSKLNLPEHKVFVGFEGNRQYCIGKHTYCNKTSCNTRQVKEKRSTIVGWVWCGIFFGGMFCEMEGLI